MATVSCNKTSVTLQEGETIAYRWVTKSEVLKEKEDLCTTRVFEMIPNLEISEY